MCICASISWYHRWAKWSQSLSELTVFAAVCLVESGACTRMAVTQKNPSEAYLGG